MGKCLFASRSWGQRFKSREGICNQQFYLDISTAGSVTVIGHQGLRPFRKIIVCQPQTVICGDTHSIIQHYKHFAQKLGKKEVDVSKYILNIVERVSQLYTLYPYMVCIYFSGSYIRFNFFRFSTLIRHWSCNKKICMSLTVLYSIIIDNSDNNNTKNNNLPNESRTFSQLIILQSLK